MNIALNEVRSSNVKAIGYDNSARVLAVEFMGGGLYHYGDVPPEVAQEARDAESIGRFIAAEIRGKFRATKIEGDVK